MSSKNDGGPDNDFFGIQYTSSASTTATSSSEVNEGTEVTRSRTVNNVEDNRGDNKGGDNKELSGTEFFDRAFFPELTKKHPSSEEQPDYVSGEDRNIFEAQYMKNHKSEEIFADESEHDMHDGKRQRSKKRMQQSFEGPPKWDQLGENEDVDGVQQLVGLSEIREKMDPIWTLSNEHLVDYMVGRLVHCDKNLVAFDKPYGMSYSGGPSNRPQFDRIIQQIKSKVAPGCERLHLVKSVDRLVSGVLLFATSSLLQSELKERVSKGDVEHTYRCIARGQLPNSPLNINIPLIKQMKNKDVKMLPLLDSKTKNDVYYVDTLSRTINGSEYCSHVELITKNEVTHQGRVHLSLAGCPLIGDTKYSTNSPLPPKLSHHVMNRLAISPNQAKKLPMMMHLKEISVPPMAGSQSLIIRAPLPSYFVHVLRKLKLFKK